MRNKIFVGLVVLFLSSCEKNKPYWINFYWESAKIAGINYEKYAMLTDFNLGNTPKLSIQLDTGSSTFFKDSIIESYLKYYPKYRNNIDSTNKFDNINNLRVDKALRNINLYFSDTLLNVKKAIFYPKAGQKIDSIMFANYRNHIGTLGIDAFKDKIVIIDYPNKQFTLQSEPLGQFKKKSFFNFEVDYLGRVLLPFVYQEKEYFILFDTGASLFPLSIYNKEFWKDISDSNSEIDSLQVSSFGKLYTTYKSKIKRGVTIADLSLDNKAVFYSTRPHEKNYKNGKEIIGLTGNAMFFEEIIMIDFKNKQFSILEKE